MDGSNGPRLPIGLQPYPAYRIVQDDDETRRHRNPRGRRGCGVTVLGLVLGVLIGAILAMLD